MIRGKKILITGGAGFIGTHVAERLAADNEVTLLDIDLGNALPWSRLASNDRVRKVEGDVSVMTVEPGELDDQTFRVEKGWVVWE